MSTGGMLTGLRSTRSILIDNLPLLYDISQFWRDPNAVSYWCRIQLPFRSSTDNGAYRVSLNLSQRIFFWSVTLTRPFTGRKTRRPD